MGYLNLFCLSLVFLSLGNLARACSIADCCHSLPVCGSSGHCVKCSEVANPDQQCQSAWFGNPNAKCNMHSGRCYNAASLTSCASHSDCTSAQTYCDKKTSVCRAFDNLTEGTKIDLVGDWMTTANISGDATLTGSDETQVDIRIQNPDDAKFLDHFRMGAYHSDNSIAFAGGSDMISGSSQQQLQFLFPAALRSTNDHDACTFDSGKSRWTCPIYIRGNYEDQKRFVWKFQLIFQLSENIVTPISILPDETNIGEDTIDLPIEQAIVDENGVAIETPTFVVDDFIHLKFTPSDQSGQNISGQVISAILKDSNKKVDILESFTQASGGVIVKCKLQFATDNGEIHVRVKWNANRRLLAEESEASSQSDEEVFSISNLKILRESPVTNKVVIEEESSWKTILLWISLSVIVVMAGTAAVKSYINRKKKQRQQRQESYFPNNVITDQQLGEQDPEQTTLNIDSDRV
mmetsp:Transcript_49617/g.56920  ORF Transcript_49617/g.56920 Transcript_49617/m.56920 type:complete len:464 (-) Transcript_49617:160-1551(-)